MRPIGPAGYYKNLLEPRQETSESIYLCLGSAALNRIASYHSVFAVRSSTESYGFDIIPAFEVSKNYTKHIERLFLLLCTSVELSTACEEVRSKRKLARLNWSYSSCGGVLKPVALGQTYV